MKIDSFNVTLQFENELVSGVPASDEDREKAQAKTRAWVKAQLGEDPPDDLVDKAMEDIPVGVGRVFKREDGTPVIETRQVKAMIREAAQRLGLLQGGAGKPGRQHVQHDVEVVGSGAGRRFYIPIEGDVQVGERPVHVMTAQGPRSDIQMFEYADQPEITFVVKVLNGVAKSPFNEDTLTETLEAAGIFMGLGADRSQGFGRFTIKEVTRV